MAKPIKIPRKLAGVKIPKVLRKGPVGDFVNSAAGQLIIAEAVTLAIGALAARRTATGERAATTLAQRVAETSPEGLRESGDRLARAFRAGLDAFRESLQSGEDEVQEGTGEVDGRGVGPGDDARGVDGGEEVEVVDQEGDVGEREVSPEDARALPSLGQGSLFGAHGADGNGL
jgi:hypothetical protein